MKDITLALEKAEANLQQIRDLNPEEINFCNTVKALENLSYELYYAWGLVTHLDSVCNSAELREVHNEMLPDVSAFGAKITLDAELWKVSKFCLEATQLRPLNRSIVAFWRKPFWTLRKPELTYQMRKGNAWKKSPQELAQVTQKFSEQVLDATNEWKLVVREEDKLKGLPETAREAARQSAIEKLGEEEGKNAWVFTFTHLPCCQSCNIWKMTESVRKYGWPATTFA